MARKSHAQKTASRRSALDRLYCRALGDNLRTAREARRLTQSELAVAAGVAQPTIQRIEAGLQHPTVGKFQRICTILSIQLESVLPPVDVKSISV